MNNFQQQDNKDLVVFYADDDEDDRNFFMEAMEEISPETTLSIHERGDTLINALNHPPPTPNIVFLDLNMPGKTGLEILKEIRKEDVLKNVFVVILTTSDDEQTKQNTYKLGADQFITKPVNFADLKTCLTKAIETYGSKTS